MLFLGRRRTRFGMGALRVNIFSLAATTRWGGMAPASSVRSARYVCRLGNVETAAGHDRRALQAVPAPQLVHGDAEAVRKRHQRIAPPGAVLGGMRGAAG